jgi:hypothetical protein
MALRTPLLLENPSTVDMQITTYDSFLLAWLHSFAPYAYANNPSGPSAKLEVNTANGTLLSGQPFVDTYYIAGTSTTRVDRFATEAETPNISMVTDNYNRIRVVYDSVSLPTGDTNNLQYPLYLYNDGGVIQLRAMTNQDFIDSCVIPALNVMAIWLASTTNQQSGTYFLTTNASPANATLVSATPVAVNSVADVAAFTAGGIPEATKQTIDTNYYLARLNFAPTAYDVYDATTLTYYLPLYFDAGTESIRQHTPTTWAALLGPFLRHYLATPGTGYYIEYNLTDGNQRGTTYTDTRVTPTGTGYTQRFVNDDDYRTQEFPTGTASTITANTKAFYIKRITESISLLGDASVPQSYEGEDPYYDDPFSGPIWAVNNGFSFSSNGNIYKYSALTTPETNIFSSSEWCNAVPSVTYYIRATHSPIPFSSTQVVPNSGDALNVWHSLATTRRFSWSGADSGGPVQRDIMIKVEIAADAAGSNIIATGYYRCYWADPGF